MAQAILTSKGTIVPRRSVRRLSQAEEVSEIEKRKRDVFITAISEKLGTSIKKPAEIPDDIEPYADDETPQMNLDDVENDPVDSNGQAVFEKPVLDHFIHAEVSLPKGENIQLARVIGLARNEDGSAIGMHDDNPMLNTLVYDVEFPGGTIKEYAANVIAENLYSQVDTDGRSYMLLDAIIDYKKNENAVSKADKYVTTKSGRRRLRKSTAGWKLLVAWKDGTEQWIPLSTIKESNPVDVAEFAKSVGIDDEPAFDW